MIEHDEARPAIAGEDEHEPDKPHLAWSWGIFICLLAFIACFVLMIAPDNRLIGSKLMAPLQTTHFLVWLGSWLPTDFHWLTNASDSYTSTNNIEFLFFVGLAFVFYGAAMLFLLRLPARANYARIQALMWVCVALAGTILMLTPFLLSHDLFVYSDYGHTIITYRANLYFTPPVAVSPHSNITWLDDWNYSVAAYGPLWLAFTLPVALVSGDHPVRYILSFRALGLMAHVINIWLVMRILRASGRSPRTIMLGTLLYALNPLTLVESALGAHNDTEMITFLLLGILLCLHADKRGYAHVIDYALPAIVFTLAILIKYTSIPVLVFYLVLLARKTMLANATSPPLTERRPSRLLAALYKPCIAGGISASLVLLAYAPFWIGHNLTAIVKSFSAPPSARFAENSILRAAEGWIQLHGLPPNSSWMHPILLLMANHTTWNIASIIAVLGGMTSGIIMLWRRPNTLTLATAALLTLGALLIVTPWLFAWYVTWLIALAAILVGQPIKGMLNDALIAFAIAFSISIFFTYMDNDLPIFGNEGFAQCLRIFGIPLLIFLLALCVRRMWPRVNTA